MKKILIVDDESNIRRLAAMTLKSVGEIHEAKDGIEASNQVQALKPDLVILDVMMPGKVGYQVCEEIRRNPETAHIPVLFLSARDSAVSMAAIEACGGDRFLPKPFDPKQLREVARDLLANGRHKDKLKT